MALVFHFDTSFNKDLTEDQKKRVARIKEKYEGKRYQNAEELIQGKKELDNELFEITGKKTFETNCKYGTHMYTTVLGYISTLINSAQTPEEKSKWQRWSERFQSVADEAYDKTVEAENNGAINIKILTDTMGKTFVTYYSADSEAKIETFLKELNAAVKEDMRKLPPKGKDYTNNDFVRDSMEAIAIYTDIAINGYLDEEYGKTDDYLIGNTLGAFIPGVSPYGEGPDYNNNPYCSNYARFEHLVPGRQPAIRGLRLVNGNQEYQKKAKNGASREDEIKIRENILIEGAECLYAIDKIQKNMVNEEVKAAFPKETEGAFMDAIGNRSQLNNWAAIERARRKLIVNGWAMTDIVAIGRLAALESLSKINSRNVAEAWNEYENYEKKLQEYKEKKARGETVQKPSKPPKPSAPKYSEEEFTAIEKLIGKLNTVLDEAPANEERRKELINSLIEEMDRLPEQTKKRYPPFAGMREDLRRAAEHQLSAVEKEILADPTAFREMEKLHPVRKYTEEEQQRDLKWLAELKEKDKELNNIFQAEPYAHDKIRQIQALAADNPHFIAEAVKKCIGEEAWNSYPAVQGRERDDLKAIDILTHQDSPYRVSADHKLLNDVENEVRSRIISLPQKNTSNIGFTELVDLVSQFTYLIPTISPEIKNKDLDNATDEAFRKVGEGTGFDRQNEYMDRLNKVLVSPGELNDMQQREEIGRCITGLLMPITAEVQGFRRNDKLFAKENLSEEEKKQMETSYTRLFNISGGLISASYAEKIKPVLQMVDKGLDRADELMMAKGHEVSAAILKPFQNMIKNVLRGTSTMKVDSMDPVIKIVQANLRNPAGLFIDRANNPIIPGQTEDFTFDEMEEKKDIFPIHKAFKAECELKEIWSEYLSDRQKGPLTPEKEREYWNRVDERYKTLETVLGDLKAKQEADPSFADNNMRFLRGQSEAKKSFEDSVSGARGMIGPLHFIPGRRQAVQNGWPLSELGLYSHLANVVEKIDKHIAAVEAGGDTTKKYADNLKEIKQLLNDKIFGKPYEKDPAKRAELFGEIADRIKEIEAQKEWLDGLGALSDDTKAAINNAAGNLNNVNHRNDKGGMPLEYEIRLAQKEAEIEVADKARHSLDEIKNIADPIVYNELRHLADTHSESPKQDFMRIDAAFVEKADIYLNSGMGSLARNIEAVKQGKETTLCAKTALTHENAINAVYDMLNASDSFFHFDSKQYKTVKEGLKKLQNGTATAGDKEKLKEDVKTWLTDPKYDRIHKHSKNDFDNTRFNIMFTLANELDPAWAKAKFSEMNIAGLHGEKAANTSFHNVHEFTNFMHRQMADGGFLRDVTAVGRQYWYLKTDSYGQKGLVEEVIRLRQDAAYTEKDRLKAEFDNINKLAGTADNMAEDLNFRAKLPILDQYRQDLNRILENGMEENQLARAKKELINVRNNAVAQIKTYLESNENEKSKIFDKAVLAFGVVDPKGAHNYITDLNMRRNGNNKVRSVNLVSLEAEHGLDIGGRKALNKKKADLAAAAQKRAEARNGQNVNANRESRPEVPVYRRNN